MPMFPVHVEKHSGFPIRFIQMVSGKIAGEIADMVTEPFVAITHRERWNIISQMV